VCTNHITEAGRKWDRDRIIIILQWMNGYGIPHPLSSTLQITCRPTPAHGISMMRWSRGMLMEEWAMTGTPWPPYPPVPTLIYTLATTQTEIAN